MLWITKSSKLSGPGRNGDTATKRAGGSKRNTGRPLVPIVGCSLVFSRTTKDRPKWCDFWQPRQFVLNDIRRFAQKLIPTIRLGSRTLRNDLMYRWLEDSKENDGSATSGKSNKGCVQSASRKSPKLPDGTAIMSYGDQKEDQTGPRTEFCSIPLAINTFTTRAYPFRNRVR